MKHRILFVLLVLSTNLFAQNQFNAAYSDASGLVLRNIITTDTSYIVVGGCQTGSFYGLYVAILNLEGYVIDEKKYFIATYSIFHGVENSLIKTYDGGFAIAGSINKTDSNASLLVKFDKNLDTLWTKTYLLSSSYTATYQCKQTPDSGFVITGHTDYGNAQYDYDALLIKTDSLGNMEWYKKYGHAGGYDKTYIVENAFDGGYLLAGASNIDGTSDCYLVKTDSDGNQEWYKTYGSTEFGEGKINDIVILNDGSILIAASFSHEWDEIMSMYKRKSLLLKVDTFGEIIWSKEYGTLDYYNFLMAIEVLENGNIALMRLNGNSGHRKNDINMLDANGNFLWQRSFRQFPSYSSYDEYLNTIISTPDQGFAMAGWGYSPSASPTQQMWVVKTDSLGCDGTGNCNDTALMLVSYPDTVCYYGDTTQLLLHIQGVSAPYSIYLDGALAADSVFYPSIYSNVIEVPICFTPDFVNSNQSVLVTITDGFGNSVIENITFYVKDCDLGVEEFFSGGIEIYPNPATNNKLRITNYELRIMGGVRLEIYGVEGKKEIEIEDFDIKDEIDISSLNNGIYLVRMVTEKGVFTRKLVVGGE